ncbi:hypothetical protein TREMEDRAFT_72262 [Tremella mesenterica DSM 1558]|uniref:uncharacterized protein n=1 Tax=Tremella mesenterica (strain ATCC 24925 / CBS 8224 / DSM 1558 / NBRC 9311 / NRRL Y-6157 / RJB 2259-6 / UBC 559-6) TaxID=578456 RepID=UPI0003F4A15D|nr:uncharacterized protein TREMEDRAFT_72262 [Tremella mesenterica DSM 1558]EIW66885.1 hypothetical protein TREMEDRAFT_72262 [Tremella mesenterica DSM 1558]
MDRPQTNNQPADGSLSQPRPPSDDFGAFSSAPVPGGLLQAGDLLGSFEDKQVKEKSHPIAHPSQTAPHTPPNKDIKPPDLLGDIHDPWGHPSPLPSNPHAEHAQLYNSSSLPIHVKLPPRPFEISPEYVPPLRCPRQLSQHFYSPGPGPGSPPLVSNIGNDIVFHPPHESERPIASSSSTSSGSRLRRLSDTWLGLDSLEHDPFSPTQSRLLNTLATTTKVASKWKSVLDPHSFPHADDPALPKKPSVPPSATALPIGITHTTPFATPEELSGSYIAPTGAPAFNRRVNDHTSRPEDSSKEWVGVRLTGRREGTHQLLNQTIADKLRACLPPRQRLASQWQLLFSLDQHGASLSSLYRLVTTHIPNNPSSTNLLLVRDGDNHVFGVYIAEHIQKKEGTYYGSGECFLFKFRDDDSAPCVFRWTGRNQYFALCETNYVSFGGGNGTYGLLLDSTFTRNSTATCPTFDNEVLCHDGIVYSEKPTSFDCLGVEVWAI